MSHFESSHPPGKITGFNKRNNNFYQRKDTINEPHGIMIKDQSFFSAKPIPVITVQRKCEACEEEKVQRKEGSSQSSEAGNDISSYINSLSSKGSSLPDKSKKFFERGFGYDFSDIKIHTDNAAAKSAQSINALAYTVGNNIVFNENQFSPASDDGKKLLAHELTHVVQQKGNTVRPRTIQRLKVSSAGTHVDGTCGKFERRFTFTIAKPIPTDGYLIQKITRYDNEVNCPGRAGAANPAPPFWEAFFVKANASTFYRQGIGFTDSSSHDARPNKSGKRYAYGEIRFFPIAVTGNLGRNRKAGLWKPGNAGGAPPSGNLPSVDKEPQWWNKHIEGPETRYVTADWRCCADGKNYNVIKSSV